MSDFRRFYRLDMPESIHTREPAFLCDLLDGLEGIPESQYRAFMLEHHPVEADVTDDTARLGYMGWGTGMMLDLDMRNRMEAIRVMLARLLGDRKSEYTPMLPPGAKDKRRESNTLDITHSSFASLAAFLGQVG